LKTYSTQAELRDALKALPIHNLTARCVYYQLINGIGYEPNQRKKKGSGDNVFSINIPGIDEGISITGELFDTARQRALARIVRERKRDKSDADTLSSIEYNARRYRVAAPTTVNLLRIVNAIEGEIIAESGAIRRELAAINAVSRGRNSALKPRTKRERNTQKTETISRRGNNAAVAAAG
tara:strand:+ start:1019 stop:1561 length:543 start_codon:yes stop_codon:yes gene_type:complete